MRKKRVKTHLIRLLNKCRLFFFFEQAINRSRIGIFIFFVAFGETFWS
jgi:hypothetical protein